MDSVTESKWTMGTSLLLCFLVVLQYNGCFDGLANSFNKKEKIESIHHDEYYTLTAGGHNVNIRQEYDPESETISVFVNNKRIGINPINCSKEFEETLYHHEIKGNDLYIMFGVKNDGCTTCGAKVNLNTGEAEGQPFNGYGQACTQFTPTR